MFLAVALLIALMFATIPFKFRCKMRNTCGNYLPPSNISFTNFTTVFY